MIEVQFTRVQSRRVESSLSHSKASEPKSFTCCSSWWLPINGTLICGRPISRISLISRHQNTLPEADRFSQRLEFAEFSLSKSYRPFERCLYRQPNLQLHQSRAIHQAYRPTSGRPARSALVNSIINHQLSCRKSTGPYCTTIGRPQAALESIEPIDKPQRGVHRPAGFACHLRFHCELEDES